MTNCIILYAGYNVRASYYDDWIDSFERSSAFDITKLNICNFAVKYNLKRLLKEADLVILHHSVNADHVFYLEPLCLILADRKCLLLSFVGNEVSLPGAYLSTKRKVLASIAPDYIATQLPLEAGEFLWGDLVTKAVLPLPHALNPHVFVSRIDSSSRPIDIGVRAFRYPPHLGDNDRNAMFDMFREVSSRCGLNVDIGQERFGRDDWVSFLNQCKGTISSEAGSWYLSKDDSFIKSVESKFGIKQNTFLSRPLIKRFGHMMPWSFRSFAANFLRHFSASSGPSRQEMLDAFSEFSQPTVYSKCISSRHFDAIGTRTVQILLEGRYNDVLIPKEHYICLKRDYSNFDEVISSFLDVKERNRIAESAYQHVMDGHTYGHRIQQLVSMIFH